MKTIELKLHCDLDDVELRERGQQMAEAKREFARVAKEKADAMKDFKLQLEEIDARMSTAAEAIREKSEFRLVKCQVLYNVPAVAAKRTVRLDTGEVVREEPMTAGEQQQHLFAAESPPEDFLPK
jgi:hypothetical protein